jgi:outer membrane receptor protein involved in Fe transport
VQWVELQWRFAARQDRVDETFPENETPSWNTLNLRMGWEPSDGTEFEVGVANLLDENYHLHLTREALLPVGDLGAGDEVPEPGRYAYLAARLTF